MTAATKSFIHADFLLGTRTARMLYHDFARELPIVDYHSHLDPAGVAKDRRFRNLTELWLDGDHYKWRALRANGVNERLISGNGGAREKFDAWAATVPATLRNPLYHWTHLELAKPFGVDTLLDERTADAVWERTEEMLAQPEFSTRGILRQFDVRLVGTTDDPADSLEHHGAFARVGGNLRMIPTFRPDRVLAIEDPKPFRDYLAHLGKSAGMGIQSFDDLLEALRRRAGHFVAHGCRASDHGLEYIPPVAPSRDRAVAALRSALQGDVVGAADAEVWRVTVMDAIARIVSERGWVMQLHVGPLRNVNPRLAATIGKDAGADTIGDREQIRGLAAFLGRLEADGALPRTILYNVNPAANLAFAALAGCFQDGVTAGRIQYGAAWWFNDQKDGIERQIEALSNCGLLSRFVGMTADSRSLLSMSRHDYFRRVLCGMLGADVEAGILPDEAELLGSLVRKVCYQNAHEWFCKDE